MVCAWTWSRKTQISIRFWEYTMLSCLCFLHPEILFIILFFLFFFFAVTICELWAHAVIYCTYRNNSDYFRFVLFWLLLLFFSSSFHSLLICSFNLSVCQYVLRKFKHHEWFWIINDWHRSASKYGGVPKQLSYVFILKWKAMKW